MIEFPRFVIGLRFACGEENGISPRECWRILLSQLPPDDTDGFALYGAFSSEETEPERAYVCAIADVSIARGKRLFRQFSCMPYLLSYLTIYQPLVMNNRIEKLKDVTFLGRISSSGAVEAETELLSGLSVCGAPFDEERVPKGTRILIVPDSCSFGRVTSADAARLILRAASQVGTGVRMQTQLFADGGAGTLDALICSANGRYEHGSIEGDDCEKREIRFGIMPDRTVVLEAQTLTKAELFRALTMPKNKGFHRYLVAFGGREAPCDLPDGAEATFLGATAPKESISPCVRLRSAADIVLETGSFDKKLQHCDLLVTATRLLDPDGRLLGAAADELIYRARKAGKPFALLAFGENGTFYYRTSKTPMTKLSSLGSYEEAAKEFCALVAKELHGE